MSRRPACLALRRAAALAGAAVLAGACGASPPGAPEAAPVPTATPEPPPVLSVPMVDLGRVVVFIPFGATLANGALNPAYDLVTAGREVEVRAVAPGTVTAAAFQSEYDDFEVHVRPAPSSDYLIIYDHVRDLTVAVGATVRAGDVVGRVGHSSPGQGRTELQINRRGSPDVSLCPRDLGTEAFNAAHDAALAATRSPHPSVCLASTVRP